MFTLHVYVKIYSQNRQLYMYRYRIPYRYVRLLLELVELKLVYQLMVDRKLSRCS